MRVPVQEAPPPTPSRTPDRRALVPLVLFALLTAAVAAGATGPIDRAAVRAAQAHPAVWLDWLSWAISLGGHIIVSGPLVLVLAALLWRRDEEAGVALIVAFTAATLVEIAGKQWIPHPGPGRELYRELPAWLPFVFSGVGETIELHNSYPSGHALRVTFLAVVLTMLWPTRWLVLGGIVAIALMAFTRVYAAEHWLSDVTGGIILGAGAAWLISGWLTDHHTPRP